MSFFPGMLTPAPAGQMKFFHLAVNEHGECVVTSLDPEGRPVGFAVANAGMPLLHLLAARLGTPSALHLVQTYPLDHRLVRRILGWHVKSWADAVAVLNGKPCATQTKVRALAEAAPESLIDRFVTRQHVKYRPTWQITEEGRRLDAMAPVKAPPPAEATA